MGKIIGVVKAGLENTVMGRKRRRNVEIEEPEELEVDNGNSIDLI